MIKIIDEAIEVDTDKWCYTYNKRVPSGYGTWFFKIGNEEIRYISKYSEAKKEAMKYAKSKNVSHIELMT